MRYQDIKRKLIAESSVILAVFCVLGALTYYIGAILDEHAMSKSQLESQVAAITGERSTLQQKYSKIQTNADLYRLVMDKYETEGLSLSRKLLRRQINEFKPRFLLNSLKLNVAPSTVVQGGDYRRGNNVISASEVIVSFDALTDEDIYDMIKAMHEEFSGSLKINSFFITRENRVTDENLRALAQDGKLTMVRGEMKLTWFGIEPAEGTNADK